MITEAGNQVMTSAKSTNTMKPIVTPKDMIAGMKESFPACEDRLGAEADQILAPFRAALLMAEQHLCELEKKAKKTYAAMQAVLEA